MPWTYHKRWALAAQRVPGWQDDGRERWASGRQASARQASGRQASGDRHTHVGEKRAVAGNANGRALRRIATTTLAAARDGAL